MVVTKLSVTKLLLLRSYQNGCSCSQFLLHNKMSLLLSYKIVIIIVCRYQNSCYQNVTFTQLQKGSLPICRYQNGCYQNVTVTQLLNAR